MSDPLIICGNNPKRYAEDLPNQKPMVGSFIPAGLEYLYSACRTLYPDQHNPLQVTAVVKFWLGGPDPLDYISMYYNHGDSAQQIPPHWHYVSFGLSDLHGDGRVHEVSEPHLPSGFGFELTMRVKCKEGEKTPPTWPATLMQSLAKYVFQTDSVFCAGDHVSWHSALDSSESRIQHMLISEDPKLRMQNTPFGRVQFLQVVGLTAEELQAAQRWNGSGVLNIMKRFPECGGVWHITDMRRGESIFDMDPMVADEIENGIETEGSNLSGVSAKISWSLLDDKFPEVSNISPEKYKYSEMGRLESALEENSSLELTPNNNESIEAQNIQIERLEAIKLNENGPPEKSEAFVAQPLPSLQLTINLESASLLPLVLRGRLKHGRHFTFKSPLGLNALTFLTPSVEGGFVSSSAPYAIKGLWLQVLVDDELLEVMSRDLAPLMNPEQVTVPISYEWRSKKLKIIVIVIQHRRNNVRERKGPIK